MNELVGALQEIGGEYVVAYDVESAHQERTSHYIVFVSKRFVGYDIMKNVMYKLSTDPEVVKEFGYRPRRSGQLRLLDIDPSGYSIPALKQFLMEVCAGETMLVKECYRRHSVDTPYIFEHFQQALRELERERRVQFDRPPEKRMRKGQVTVGEGRRITFAD